MKERGGGEKRNKKGGERVPLTTCNERRKFWERM